MIIDLFSHKVLRKPFKKGAVVICKCPYDTEKTVCKRIAGVEGETAILGDLRVVIPRGHVWLLGDNTGNSTDSRKYGPVPTQLIIGTVVLKLFPSLGKPFEVVRSEYAPITGQETASIPQKVAEIKSESSSNITTGAPTSTVHLTTVQKSEDGVRKDENDAFDEIESNSKSTPK